MEDDKSALQTIVEALAAAPGGIANGARSFADQARWQMGGFGNAPMPAPYEGGAQYPSPDDANAYVRNNYPATPMGVMVAPQGSGWGPTQQLPPARQVDGPYPLMPARDPVEQARRDQVFSVMLPRSR